MKKHKRRFTRKHTFMGEAEGVPLVRWLNSADRKSERERRDVAETLGLYAKIRERLEGRTPDEVLEALPEVLPDAGQINSLLEGYRYCPRIRLRKGESANVLFAFMPTWTDPEGLISRSHGIGSYYGPEIAISDMMALAHRGLLHFVRQCACGKWLYAKFPQSRHCSAACRLKAFRSKPNWTERRREWARKNRKVHETLDTGGARYPKRRRGK